MSDSNGFLVGGEIFKKTEFNAKFHMVLKQADQTWMKKVLKISQMSLDISPKVFLTLILSKLDNIFVGLRPASDLKLFFDALGVLAAVRLWPQRTLVSFSFHCADHLFTVDCVLALDHVKTPFV